VEDGLHDGGIGQLIADAVHAVKPDVCVESLGVPTKFIPHNKPDAILAQFGLDAAGITTAAQRLLA
jgi:1-deoxy-D-xylulose-5-phosphate synthase